MTLSQRHKATLCIGFDLAWWGGSDHSKVSQADVGWSALLSNEGRLSELETHRVDLSGTNEIPPNDWPLGSCRDPRGACLTDEIIAIISRKGTGGQVVLALDAPLEAEVRDGERPRRKVFPRGELSGARHRDCERELKRFFHAMSPDWARDVRVQPGAPLFPRVHSIVCALKARGFLVGARGRPIANATIVEVFPSASIAMNGAAGGYGGAKSSEVRRYKSAGRVGDLREAKGLSRAPLLGFHYLLGITATDVADAVEHVSCSSLSWKGGAARLRKGFDDPVDGGIALLTAVCAALEIGMWFGDGVDGAILTPPSRTELSPT